MMSSASSMNVPKVPADVTCIRVIVILMSSVTGRPSSNTVTSTVSFKARIKTSGTTVTSVG